MPYLVRVDGPAEALPVSGRVGALSWGDITSLPLNTPVRVKALTVGLPSADSGAHNADVGSKRETIRRQAKTAEEIIAEIRREYHTLTFEVFDTLDEAKTYLSGQQDYWSILGVERGACKDAIRKAWIQASLIYHPDLNPGSEEKMKQVNLAYEALSR